MQISFSPVCSYHLNFSRPHLPLAIDRIMEKQWLKRFGHASTATWKSPCSSHHLGLPVGSPQVHTNKPTHTRATTALECHHPKWFGLEHRGTVLSPWQTHGRGFWKPCYLTRLSSHVPIWLSGAWVMVTDNSVSLLRILRLLLHQLIGSDSFFPEDNWLIISVLRTYS